MFIKRILKLIYIVILCLKLDQKIFSLMCRNQFHNKQSKNRRTYVNQSCLKVNLKVN